jgi:acetolactate synthase-1/2/3 large subunit
VSQGDRAGQRAADLLVDCLAAQGVDRIFCVPGESYLALLDALAGSASIDLVTCRHEGGAGFMALTDAKITGRPGVAAVSRGPGATNASIAVHMAEQDAVPMLLLIGQVARADRGRGAFQEVDYGSFFADMAKGVWEVGDPAEIPQTVADAFGLAQAGTPGPAIISLPEDMLHDTVAAEVVSRTPPEIAEPSDAEVVSVLKLLSGSVRPLVIAGGALRDGKSRDALRRAAEAHQLPVALSFKHQDVLDNAHPSFAGYLGFKIPRPQVDAMAEADLVIAVGTRLTDVTTQNYAFPLAPKPKQPLVHVYSDGDAIGRAYETDHAIAADPALFLERLAAAPSTQGNGRAEWRDALHKRAADLAAYVPRNAPDGVDFGAVVHALTKHTAPDAAIVTDAGNFSSWVHRHWPWGRQTLLLGAAGGAMGLGMPGAVAAGLRFSDRQVLCFVGDGGALMTGSELATAVRQNVPVKIFISNNASYGTIRQHQERDFPGRGESTGLTRPDFAKWAESLGARGLVIDTGTDIDKVIAEALETKDSVVVDVRSSLELISAYTTISEIRGGR